RRDEHVLAGDACRPGGEASVGPPRLGGPELEDDPGIEQVHQRKLSRRSQASLGRASSASISARPGMASRSTIDSLWPVSWRKASMLISTWVGLPRSVTNTGSLRATRFAWLTSW